MGERKFTGTAAIPLHIQGDIHRLPDVRCWSGDRDNSPFVTQTVSGDLRVHDLVRQEICHLEVESLLRERRSNIVPWTGFNVLVRKKAATALHSKADRTFGRIHAWAHCETLSEHRCGCEHDGKWENTGELHVCLLGARFNAAMLLRPAGAGKVPANVERIPYPISPGSTEIRC